MTLRISEEGSAEAEWVMEMPPSAFTDLEIISFTGGTMGGATVHGIGVENAKIMYLSELQSSYAHYGWDMDHASCDLFELETGGPLRVTAGWTIPFLSHREDGVWRITIEPVDRETYAQFTLNHLKNIQANLSLVAKMLSSDCQLVAKSTTTYLLPGGAEITNHEDLRGFSCRIDFGGGTVEVDEIRVTNINGAPAVVMESQLTITTRLISITEEEFLNRARFWSIDYTGVDFPRQFEDSVAWVTADLKFGREREEYTVSLAGREYDLSPHQLLYYSAAEVIRLAEGETNPLLSGDQPIAVSPPDHEEGDWGSFLQVLSMEELEEIAREVRDHIEATGKSPDAIDSSIGKIRPRDALFSFLRAISFYREHRALPSSLKFVPAPSGYLTRSGTEVPANLVYFTLSEKYVITNTPRVQEIIASLRTPGLSDRNFAENACRWVYQNITYPVPLVLGWFTSEEVLTTGVGKCLDKANLYLAITRTAGLPTRRITGYLLFDQVGPPFSDIAGVTPEGKYIIGHAWTEVYVFGEGWLFADPTAGRFGKDEYREEVYSRVEESWQEVLASYETAYGELI